MEPQQLQQSGSPATNPQTEKAKYLFIKKVIAYSLLIAVGVTVFCLFLFKPGKFENERYRNIQGLETYSSSINTPIYSPYWWSDGFYDYCDGVVGFNPYYPHISYAERKDYLIWKAIRFGIYAFFICITTVLLYRYAKRIFPHYETKENVSSQSTKATSVWAPIITILLILLIAAIVIYVDLIK